MLRSDTFSGKTFYITGAGTGSGQRFATRAAELGATVAVAGRRESLLQETADIITRAGGRALVCKVDIRKPDEVQASVDSVVAQTGHIDVLINNAAGNFVARAEDISPNGWNAG